MKTRTRKVIGRQIKTAKAPKVQARGSIRRKELIPIKSLRRSPNEVPAASSGGEVVLYQPRGGKVQLDVRLERNSVWLTQQQMSALFGRERSVVTKHLRNVFLEGELKRGSVCADFAHTAEDDASFRSGSALSTSARS